MLRILRAKRCAIKVENITRLCSRVRPGRGWHGEKLLFQFMLMASKSFCVRFDICQNAAKVCRLLGRHSPMFVEINRFIRHAAADASFRCASASSSEPIATISMEGGSGGDEGIIMDVLMRR